MQHVIVSIVDVPFASSVANTLLLALMLSQKTV